jgi:hypothetical protein
MASQRDERKPEMFSGNENILLCFSKLVNADVYVIQERFSAKVIFWIQDNWNPSQTSL